MDCNKWVFAHRLIVVIWRTTGFIFQRSDELWSFCINRLTVFASLQTLSFDATGGECAHAWAIFEIISRCVEFETKRVIPVYSSSHFTILIFYFEWSGQRPMDPFGRKQTNCNSKPVENMGNWCLGGDCSLSPKNTQRNRSCYWPGLIEQKIIFILGPRIGVKKGMRIMTFLL